MKKIFLPYVIAAAAIVGCGKTEIEKQGTEGPAHQEQADAVELIADIPVTKTTFTDGDAIETAWKAGDAVGLYWYKGTAVTEDASVDKAVNTSLTAQSSGAEVSFGEVPSGYLSDKDSEYLTYAYYPYSGAAGTNPQAVKFTLPAEQTQTSAGSLDHLAGTDFLYASTTAKNDGTGKVSLHFNHALSVLNIVLTADGGTPSVSKLRVCLDGDNEIFSVTEGTVNLSDGTLALSKGSAEIALALETPAALSSEPSSFYMSITPGHAGRTISVYATIDGTEELIGSKKIPEGGIPAGVKAKMEFKLERSKVFADFEDGSFSAFKQGGSTLSVVDNPNGTGKVLKAEVDSKSESASGYFTILREAIVAQGINPSEYKGIRVQYLWKGTVQLVPRIAVGSDRQLPKNADDISLNGEWQTLEYEISFPEKGNRTFRPFMAMDGKPYNPSSMKEENRVCVMYFDNFTLYK